MAMRAQTLSRLRCCLAIIPFSVGVWSLSIPAASAAAASNDTSKLEEVIVTAQRRNQDLQNIGVSASVLNADQLIDKDVMRLTALQYAAPSVTISDLGSANVFNIRGVGRSQVDADLPSGVVIYRDGAPTIAGYFQNEPYYDMKSIEVLRGPQGTFVGKNAAGGAVFINTADPELADRAVRLTVGGGNFDRAELTGVVNLPMSSSSAIRFAYYHMQRNDYYDSITGNFTGHPGIRDLDSGRIGVFWEPTPKLDLLLKIDLSNLDFGGNVTSSYGHSLFKDVEQNANFAYKDRSDRTVLHIKYRLDNGVLLSSLTGYQGVTTTNNLDLNATQSPYYVFNSHGNVSIKSQEFNLISPDTGSFRWVLGTFFERQVFDIPYWQDGGFVFQGVGGVPGLIVSNAYPWATSPWHKTQDDWAAFAHGTFDVAKGLELEVGVRYSHYKMSQFTEWVFGFGDTPPVIPWPFSIPPASAGGDTQALAEHAVDGKIGLNWHIDDNNFAYVSISRGHVTGGVNLFPPFYSYGESRVMNYEAGWKATMADNRLRTQADYYYETFDNYQAQFGMPGTGPSSVVTFRNAEGKSHVQGIEVSGHAVFGNWGLDFGLATLSSKLGTFNNVVDPFTGNTVDLTGAKSPFSPSLTGDVGLDYALRLGDDYTLRPRIDYSHISKTQAGLWDSPIITLKARNLVNFNVRLTPDSGRWYATLWETNVTNLHYAGGIQNNGTLFYAAPPREYGMRVGFKLR